MEIDHIFIFTRKNAPEGDMLVDFGLSEGSPNTHPGQGTACRRFYFHNFMLELLWVEKDEEIQNERTKPMRLLERSIFSKETSPFGLAFRPTVKEERFQLETWNYKPIYLPDYLQFQIVDKTPLEEPMYFYISFANRQDSVPLERRQPMEHKISLMEATAINVYVNTMNDLSGAASELNDNGNICIIKGTENYLEIEFDNYKQNKIRDFRPYLPIILKW